MNFIIWEMHGFCHQLPIVRENATKAIAWGKPGKLVLILFSQYGCFFSHQIPILWYTSSYGKCMVFLINFPQHGKRQQNLSNGESLRNWLPYRFHSMSVLSIRFPSCGILNHLGNACVFSSISNVMEKAAKPLEWGKPGKLTPILFPQYECFLSLDSHPVVYFIIREMHRFPFPFLIAWENPTKPMVRGRTWEIGIHIFAIVWVLFFHQILILLWYSSSL